MSRVVDDDMRDVEIGEVGELVVKGPQVMSGYWRRPEANEEAFFGGWFHSGDLAKWDKDGNLYIVDRKKDMIITGGENVYSREVEEVLYTHPAVADAAVIGAPDEEMRRTSDDVDVGVGPGLGELRDLRGVAVLVVLGQHEQLGPGIAGEPVDVVHHHDGRRDRHPGVDARVSHREGHVGAERPSGQNQWRSGGETFAQSAHRGFGVDARINAAQRAGYDAANRTATSPPNDTPQIAARSTSAAVSSSAIRRA